MSARQSHAGRRRRQIRRVQIRLRHLRRDRHRRRRDRHSLRRVAVLAAVDLVVEAEVVAVAADLALADLAVAAVLREWAADRARATSTR